MGGDSRKRRAVLRLRRASLFLPTLAVLLLLLPPSSLHGTARETPAPVRAEGPRSSASVPVPSATLPWVPGLMVNTSASTNWTMVCNTGGCPLQSRESPAMADDPADGEVVLFGGLNTTSGVTLNDTWAYRAGTGTHGWTEISSASHGPSVRWGAQLVWDASDGYLLLFGGIGPPLWLNQWTAYSDTWIFRAGNWTELFPAVQPSARSFYSAAYDPVDGYAVLFGGCAPMFITGFCGGMLGDTWKFTAGNWTQLSPGIAPSNRMAAGIAFDGAADRYVVLFGGQLGNNNRSAGDTWRFSGGRWSNITSAVGAPPSPRSLEVDQMTWDTQAGAVLLFGGCHDNDPANHCNFLYSDTWFFSGGHWSLQSPTIVPTGRYSSGMADDLADHALVLFGGYTYPLDASDTWTFASNISAFTLTALASPAVAAAGTPIAFHSLANYGTPPISYSWRFGDGGAAATALTNHTYLSVGLWTANVWANATGGARAYAFLNVTISVGPLSSVSVAPSTATLPPWGWQGFDAASSCLGGACPSPPRYSWAMNRPLGSFNATTGSVVLFTAGGTAGTTYLFVNATLNGVTVQSHPVLVQVLPSPPTRYVLTFSINHAVCSPVLFNGSSAANGSSVSFLAGTYPLHALTCTGHTFSRSTYRSDAGAVQTFSSPWGNVSVSANGTLWVNYTANPPLTVSLVASATTVSTGGSLTLTPTISGGASPYTCLWSLNGTNTSQTGCAAASIAFAHPGTYTYRVWATDSASHVAGSNAVAITVSAPPAPAPLVAFANATSLTGSVVTGCAVSASALSTSYEENFTGNARGGSPPYAFRWTEPGAASGFLSSSRNFTTYFGYGVYLISLKVNDSAGRLAWANLTVTITIDDSSLRCGPHVGVISLVPYFLAAGLLAAVVAVVVILVVLRKHRKREEPPMHAFVR
ncbi:MAG: PKD domain-containing protein [Euryarchaeota archaeon]|nr:PKD domain-containing protein [Euryarchaeota archaeon]MDE1837708.1 PKD domain-containing protein [Euryarchaeota archaeon]MDE2045962.1 PKD domain-containing protein [Thermoplasmata archaeon]